jgi:hypothetical protein
MPKRKWRLDTRTQEADTAKAVLDCAYHEKTMHSGGKTRENATKGIELCIFYIIIRINLSALWMPIVKLVTVDSLTSMQSDVLSACLFSVWLKNSLDNRARVTIKM